VEVVEEAEVSVGGRVTVVDMGTNHLHPTVGAMEPVEKDLEMVAAKEVEEVWGRTMQPWEDWEVAEEVWLC
tara:strand:- start:534 stop:746 length:213 start_codon:yes stop_codon:yes gene_type:complete